MSTSSIRRFSKALSLSLMAAMLLACPALCQFSDQRYTLTEAERQELSTGRDHLRQSLSALRDASKRTGKPRADQLPDAEIFLDAVDRNLQQSLFFTKQNVDQARACLREGEARVAVLTEGKTPWMEQTGILVLGYRSKVDGTAQPYQVYVSPALDRAKPSRLDLFLHGRSANLNEIAFLRSTGWMRGAYGADQQPFLVLYPYGRGNNGWRFAGEQDVFEAMEDVKRRFKVDENDIMLRGFSMGGHGAWHIGLQHPDVWAAVSPGAGFVDTVNYQKLPLPEHEWQRALLHLYDPLDYALNAANLPVIAYVGELDPVIGQHNLMYEAFRRQNVPFKDLVGPQTPHRYEAKALQDILAQIAIAKRDTDARSIHFATYTTR